MRRKREEVCFDCMGEDKPCEKHAPPRINLRPMSSVKDDVPTLAWEPKPGYPGIAVGTLVIFGGRPAAGKSTSARWFVAEATNGTLPGAWHGMPVGAAWIGTEESEVYMMKPGLRAAGADLDKVVIPEVEIHHDADDSTVVSILHSLDMNGLADEFNAAGIKVVVLDPLMSAVGSRTDVNRSNEVRARLEPWVKLAEAIDGVVIGIAHLKKSFTGDVVAALNGSSAFGEVARSIFGFAKDDNADDGTRLMSHAKSSIGPESLSYTYTLEPVEVTTDSGKTATVSRFVLGEETDRTVSDALREAAAGGPTANTEDKQMSDKAAMLVQILTGPNGALLELTKDEVVAQMGEAGYSADQTRRAREELAKRCRIGKPFRAGSSGPYYWKLLPFVPPDGNANDSRTAEGLPTCHPASDQQGYSANHPQDGKDGRLADSLGEKSADGVEQSAPECSLPSQANLVEQGGPTGGIAQDGGPNGPTGAEQPKQDGPTGGPTADIPSGATSCATGPTGAPSPKAMASQAHPPALITSRRARTIKGKPTSSYPNCTICGQSVSNGTDTHYECRSKQQAAS